MHGDAVKMCSRLHHLPTRVQEFAANAERQGNAELAKAAKQTRMGMLRNPCDVVHRPETMQDAIRRVAGGIPPVTPFATLERARGDLERAKDQLQKLDLNASA